MSHTPTDDERICAWFESQTEEFLRDLFDRFGAVSPRQCWNAFFNDCSSPAPQSSGDSLAAPVEAVQGVCSASSDDFLLFRSRDLQHVLMMWTRSIELREQGACAWLHTEKTAFGMLRNCFNSAPTLGDFLARLIAGANIVNGVSE